MSKSKDSCHKASRKSHCEVNSPDGGVSRPEGGIGRPGGGIGNSCCNVCGDLKGKIEIVGDGVRNALAEMLLCGGSMNLNVTISVDAKCGKQDGIYIKASGMAIMDDD